MEKKKKCIILHRRSLSNIVKIILQDTHPIMYPFSWWYAHPSPSVWVLRLLASVWSACGREWVGKVSAFGVL